MNGEQIRERLHRGECVYGTHVALMSNAAAAAMLARCELDFAFFCGEHMPLDRTETASMCALYAGKGISPIVRISHPSAVEAAKALDAGAQGIVAPYVETVAQVREVVGAVHYRPIKGLQLDDFLSGRKTPTEETAEFLNRFNRHHYAIIGIESVAAYENLDALISVPGVDGVFMGPHDLSVSLEAPEEWDNPALFRLMEDVVGRCRAAAIGSGVHLPPGVFSTEQAQQLIAAGMNWILDGADVAWALHSLRQRRSQLMPDQGVKGATDADAAPCIAPKPAAE